MYKAALHFSQSVSTVFKTASQTLTKLNSAGALPLSGTATWPTIPMGNLFLTQTLFLLISNKISLGSS